MPKTVFHIKHGQARKGKVSRLWWIWESMHDRCRNPRNKQWKDYGGRGIQVCKEWKDFRVFLKDIGEKKTGMTLGRIDNNGHYEPSNVRWETRVQQARNTRNNRFFTVNGVTACMTEMAEIHGISVQTVSARRLRGWPDEKLFEPLHVRNQS